MSRSILVAFCAPVLCASVLAFNHYAHGASAVTATSYFDEFNNGPILPWLQETSSDQWNIISPQSYWPTTFYSRLQSPVLPILTDVNANRVLSISFTINADTYNLREQGNVNIVLLPYGNYNDPHPVTLELPILQLQGWSYQTLKYETVIPLNSIRRPAASCNCTGLLVEIEGKSYGINDFDKFRMDWSQPTPASINWDFGASGQTGIPSGWTTQTYGGSITSTNGRSHVQPDLGVPLYSTGGNEEIRVDIVSPSFQFTDISKAIFELDAKYVLEQISGFNAETITIDLLIGAAGVAEQLDSLDLFALRNYIDSADGKIRINILEALNQIKPAGHIDNQTVYRIRTRITDPDEHKDSIDFIEFDSAKLTYAVPHKPGDFNGNGQVDGGDFLVWQREFSTGPVPPTSRADANGDLRVNGQDLAMWRSLYGAASFSEWSDLSTIPEPNAVPLIGLLVFALLSYGRHVGYASVSTRHV